METYLEKKTKTKAIPVVSFNDGIVFPSTLKANKPKFITNTTSNFFMKKQTSCNFSLWNKSVSHDSFRGNVTQKIWNKNNDAQVQTSMRDEFSLRQIHQTIKKTVFFKQVSFPLNSTKDFLVPPSVNIPLRRCASLHPQKEVLHMKQVNLDQTKINRKIQQLREIEHIQKLIRIINNRKVKRNHLQNAYSLLGQKMRGIKMIESKLNLTQLSKVRKLQQQYKIIVQNKQQNMRKIAMRVYVDPTIEIIQQLHFQQPVQIQKAETISSQDDQQNDQPKKKRRIAVNYNVQSKEVKSAKQNRPVTQNNIRRKKYNNDNEGKLKSNKKLLKQTLNSEVSSFDSSQAAKIYDSDINNTQIQNPTKASQKLKQFIEKTLSNCQIKQQKNDNSTKQQISTFSNNYFQRRSSSTNNLQQLNKQQHSSPTLPLKSRVSKISRRSSKFKFGQHDFTGYLNKQQSYEINQSPNQSQCQIESNYQKLLTINTVTSQDSKQSQINNIKNQYNSLRYLKIMPIKKVSRTIKKNSVNQDLDEMNFNSDSARRKRNHRQTKRNNNSLRYADEDLFRLNLNYGKSFIENRELLQYQSKKLARFLQSQNVQVQKQVISSIHSVSKKKNEREYISANMIQQLTKDLRVQAIGDINNNFYEFQGFRYSTTKKDKVAYYGISDYTYKQDPSFKKSDKLVNFAPRDAQQDNLIQKQFGFDTVLPSTRYIINKTRRS